MGHQKKSFFKHCSRSYKDTRILRNIIYKHMLFVSPPGSYHKSSSDRTGTVFAVVANISFRREKVMLLLVGWMENLSDLLRLLIDIDTDWWSVKTVINYMSHPSFLWLGNVLFFFHARALFLLCTLICCHDSTDDIILYRLRYVILFRELLCNCYRRISDQVRSSLHDAFWLTLIWKKEGNITVKIMKKTMF